MRIFALETDTGKILRKFCHEGEQVLHETRYHGLSFFFAIMRDLGITILAFAGAAVAISYGLPVLWTLLIIFLLWFFFAFLNILKAYIDWVFDRIIITTDKIILIDQTSIFKHEIKPLHIENIGGISNRTQFWNVFPLGTLQIHLKEGMGGDDITLKYVPNAEEVASKMSDAITRYQRWKQVREESPPPPTDAPAVPPAAQQ